MTKGKSFGETASTLVDNGYLPLPIRPGSKQPALKSGWPDYRYRVNDGRRFRDAGTGLILGKVIAVDIDVRDESLASQLRKLAEDSLGRAPARIGEWPKVALLYQVEGEQFGKMATAAYRLPNDPPSVKPHRVEILGAGQQLVLFGDHPVTKQPYTWNGLGDLCTVPIGFLPSATRSQVEAFVAKAEALLTCCGTVVGTPDRAANDFAHATNERLKADDPARLRSALGAIPNNDDPYETWCKIAYAVKGALGEDGREDFLRWSRKSAKHVEQSALATWAGARPERIGAGTVYDRANLHGWQGPPRAQDAAPAQDGPRAFAVHRLDASRPDAQRGVVQHLGLDEGGLVAMVGAPGAAKTALAIRIGLAVASGKEHCLGMKVTTGSVLFFAAEGYRSVIARALSGARKVGAESPSFYISDAVPELGSDSGHDCECVLATIKAVGDESAQPVKIVFIDTLASCLGNGDENAAGMVCLVNAAKRIAAESRACVVLIHHPSKGDATGLRGHSSLGAACDTVIRVESDEHTGVRTATVIKARDHATGFCVRFELEQVKLDQPDSFGDPCTTVVVRSTEKAAAQPRPKGKRQAELLGELERRHEAGEHVWSQIAIRKMGRDLRMPRSSPDDAVRGLIEAGFLTGPCGALELKFPPALSAAESV